MGVKMSILYGTSLMDAPFDPVIDAGVQGTNLRAYGYASLRVFISKFGRPTCTLNAVLVHNTTQHATKFLVVTVDRV